MNYFVTGTDTGVGKTYVTALLLAELRRRGMPAAGFKPIACGDRDDARQYWRLMNRAVPLDLINPVYLRHPLAPSVAARREHRRIDLRRIFARFQLLTAHFHPVLVEGAGGLLVPIARDYFMADLACDLKLPVVIVARLGLGTINHTLLTIRQAQASGLTVAGVIFNDLAGKRRRGLAERTNLAHAPTWFRVPVLGVAPDDIRHICGKLFP